MRDEIVRIVNSRPLGITLRELCDELNMFGTDTSEVRDCVLRMIGGPISHLGDITDSGMFSAILMPRLIGVPKPDKTKFEVFP